MKESRFIAQNKEKWRESEKLLKESDKDPEKLSNLFTQVIDDLSYSRTYYPNRSVRVYLNRIAREYFSIIYKEHGDRKNAFVRFWKDDLPQIVYQSRRPLLISLIVFTLSMCIGVFSSVKDPEFARTILGDAYVEMTKANIESGDPMAVYKRAHEAEMFLGITLNNLWVAFQTYVFGVLFSIGTLAVLLANGVMVGGFQFFFIERGLFAESALTIWLHGTLEISSIILAGGAGLTLGSGLLFPGSYSRLQAFHLSAIRSLKLMIGITPIFVLAAIIESFLTRYTEMPDPIRLALILLSAAFIVGYFAIYPWKKAQQGFDAPLDEAVLTPAADDPIILTKVKNNGEIIKDAFTFYKRNFRKIFVAALIVTGLAALIEFLSSEPRISYFQQIMSNYWISFLNSVFYAAESPDLFYVALNAVATTVMTCIVFRLLEKSLALGRTKLFLSVMQTFCVVFIGYWLIYALEIWGVWLVIFSWLFFIFVPLVQHIEKKFLPTAITRTATLTSPVIGQVFGLQFALLLLSFSFLVVSGAPVVYFNVTILQWNFAESDQWVNGIARFIGIFLRLFSFYLVLPIFCSALAFLYFSLREINNAEYLKSSILQMANRHAKGGKA